MERGAISRALLRPERGLHPPCTQQPNICAPSRKPESFQFEPTWIETGDLLNVMSEKLQQFQRLATGGACARSLDVQDEPQIGGPEVFADHLARCPRLITVWQRHGLQVSHRERSRAP